ncbi:serine hydrolase [Acuticoccus sp. MNP-M23]|uniref:serine hydrolase n=1 Tax=Acuticoccus sp. MNP-M23 TaxID=3072793 RepID=UPI0028165203|nr:serine hydrolase [Acuticoccus sp. MNP-M23]WMS44529.1 serine hydrolase [Acuticoccus sp. MNP-M23]
MPFSMAIQHSSKGAALEHVNVRMPYATHLRDARNGAARMSRSAASAGERIQAAALARPCRWPADIRAVIEGETFDPPPFNVVIGPVFPRGEPAGTVVAGGDVLATWGDGARADMAFSVAKSYVGLLAAAALDRGLLSDFAEPVAARIDDPAFASPRNRTVTWRQLLDQTSEWEGTLFGLPDTVDRDRQLAPTDDPARFDRATPLGPPGTYWDYNDIRVNALCLALTRLYGCPLGEALASFHPAFGAATGFRWHGYGARSTIDLGGRAAEVAVGGGHWGGGVVAGVPHHLALGGIVLGRGVLAGQRALSAEALDVLLTPCPLQPVYGGLWWLNGAQKLFREAPAESVFAMGIGSTVVWVAPSLGVVAVIRWVEAEGVANVLAAIVSALTGRKEI